MKYNELKTILSAGKQPIVKFNDVGYEFFGFGVVGMVAKITKVMSEGPDSECAGLTVDYSVAKEHNLSLQTHDFWVGNAGKTGTIFEAGRMKPEHMQEILYVEMSDKFDLPFELVLGNGEPLAEYMKEKSDLAFKMTYVEWLESEYKRMSAEIEEAALEAAGESR